MVTKKGAPKKKLDVDSLRHKDKRKNIPTEELRNFVAEDEQKPGKLRYPRDPSLDPQLVWNGKDELDREDLSVPVVPIYIQEKIHPQSIIEDVRRRGTKASDQAQMDLFADFNGIEFEDLIEFYQHEQSWSNRMIVGDSLLAMTSLAEKEGLRGKVQMIYIDPPYGIKFGSNWQVSTRKREVVDGRAEDASRAPEVVRAFRDTWEKRIHSYLTFLRDRLTVSRDLLTETGSVFVQIGDENVHLVRSVLDEVFGSENFCGLIPFRKKTMPLGSQTIEQMCDFLIWYGKARLDSAGRLNAKVRALYRDYPVEGLQDWVWAEEKNGSRRRLTKEEHRHNDLLPAGARVYRLKNPEPLGDTDEYKYEFPFQNQTYKPPAKGWGVSIEKMSRLNAARRVQPKGNLINFVLFHDDYPITRLTAPWNDTIGPQDKTYVVQTSDVVVQRCMLLTTDPGDLVLDPTCGSGTTAYVAEHWGRRWITMDTSRVALALARTRLMSGRYPYYLLNDSPEGAAKESELNGSDAPLGATYSADVRRGFVYRRAAHINLKSIVNNEEIDTIDERWRKRLDPVRLGLNKLLKQKWEAWQVPAEAEESWSAQARAAHSEWCSATREHDEEIDACIRRRAGTELLYDRPYEDNKRVRVSGPFTVESLSPHRLLSEDDDAERPAGEREAQDESSAGTFVQTIIDNLRKAGIQNTKKDERLKFETIESYAGVWLHAAGTFTDKSGMTKRVVLSIGSEHSTVGSQQIKEAAKEALKGAGFDLLVVCGFAFDARAGETAEEFAPEDRKPPQGVVAVMDDVKPYGKLDVVLARMNPDLAMGDELLKKTGAGNLFMIFGEPDISPVDKATRQIVPQGDGKVVVEIRGVDVYDPTTGQVRSGSTDDIACWFIDTDYNGESFFVRHAYFTGADEPYENLQRALKAEIDEAAWADLYQTKSQPFDRPESGKIAIKVINHYGDEVLKVYEVA